MYYKKSLKNKLLYRYKEYKVYSMPNPGYRDTVRIVREDPRMKEFCIIGKHHIEGFPDVQSAIDFIFKWVLQKN